MSVQEYISANAGGFFAALKEWIAIPSISSDPERAEDVARSARWLARHLRDTPPGIRARVEFEGPGVRPCSVPIDSPAVQAAKRAMGQAFGTEVLFTRAGGSGPGADLAGALGAPLVVIGVGLDDDNAHAPARRPRWRCCSKARKPAPTCGTSSPLRSRAGGHDQARPAPAQGRGTAMLPGPLWRERD